MKDILRGVALLFIVGVCLFVGARAAAAHEISPAVVEVNFAQSRPGFDIVIRQNFEVLLAGIEFRHSDTDQSPQKAAYDRLRALPEADLARAIGAFLPKFTGAVRFEVDGRPTPLTVAAIDVEANPNVATGRTTRLRLKADGDAPARAISWFHGTNFGPAVLRVRETTGGALKTFWIEQGQASPPIELSQIRNPDPRRELADFVRVGYVHILPLGYDHILFIVGVFFLATTLRRIVTLVTTFTVAHSVTLYLGARSILVLPASFVEAGIALSIAVVGVEILGRTRERAFALKIATVFAFGLLHGLGFAGVLMDSGFRQGQILLPLVAFNVGVELGQLTVIAAMYLLVARLLRGNEDAVRRLRLGAAAVLAVAGLALFVTRLI